MWRSPSSPQIHQKYICMWNTSYRTATECWQKTSDFPRARNSPRTWVGQKKRDRTCPSGRELWRRKSSHTLGRPFSGRDKGWWGGSFWATEESQQQRCRGQSGEIPAKRISANQHSPAWEACQLIRHGGWGLGAEAWASEVRFQGEDWGWLHEHSLKGAGAPQLTWRESGKTSGTA